MKLISKLTCSLAGQQGKIVIAPGTRASGAYGRIEAQEMFACNYGLNQAFAAQIQSRDLLVSGRDEDGAVRMVELPGHPFFISTLFVPQVLSEPGRPHPLILAYLKAASSRRGL